MLGFKLQVRVADERIHVDFYPEACILESVFEFVKWRRARGATPNAIENALLERRATIRTAPLGKFGTINGYFGL